MFELRDFNEAVINLKALALARRSLPTEKDNSVVDSRDYFFDDVRRERHRADYMPSQVPTMEMGESSKSLG